jgi:chromosome segregation ATPase|tara:strand:- start:171 stop:455 length:285 start_codon:yes stop_codon:yes gene_type:complete
MSNSLNSEIQTLESKLKILVSKLDQLESNYKKINEDNSKLEVSIAIKNYQLKKQTIQSSFSSENFNTDQKENKKIKEKIDSTIIEIEELINNLN